jgi:predicted peptidase
MALLRMALLLPLLLFVVVSTSSAKHVCASSEDEAEPEVNCATGCDASNIPTGQRLRMREQAGLEWQLFLPADWRNEPSRSWPVVVFFHGSGDGHFSVMNSQSLPRLLSYDQSTCFDHGQCWRLGDEYQKVTAKKEAPSSSSAPFLDEDEDLRSPLADCDFAKHFPGIVIMPQGWLPDYRTGWTHQTQRQVEALTRHVLSTYRGDPTRVVLSGQSAGGHGAWDFAMARPSLWSALNPICMPASPHIAPHLKGLNVWVVGWAGDGEHGNDRVVQALKAQAAAGGAPPPSIRYTRYNKAPAPPDPRYSSMLNHASYDLIYRDPRLWRWAFAQRNPAGRAEWGMQALPS